MRLFKKILANFAFTLLLVNTTSVAHATCSSKPDFNETANIFLQHLKNSVEPQDSIAILPFHDNSTVKKDPLLAQSLPYAIYDFLAQTSENIYHPYLSFAAVEEFKFKDEDLSLENSAKQVAEKLNSHFVIYGSVQRTLEDTMRFFIYIYDKETGETKNNRIEFTTPLNDLFFQNIKTGLQSALRDLNLKKKALDNQKTYPSLQAFRYYVKGLNQANTYNEGSLKAALIWFEKALKEQYFNYPFAAIASARVHYQLSLIKRFAGKDPSLHWVEAHRFLTAYGKVDLKKPTPREQMAMRFYRNQEFFSKTFTFVQNDKKESAAETASEGLSSVPEDGQLQALYQTATGQLFKSATTQTLCY